MRMKITLLAALIATTLGGCSTEEKTCADFCGEGNVCSGGECVPLACTPACGPGTACQMGACVAVEAVSCAAAYPGCSACDTTLATPAWVDLCGAGTTCETAGDACISTATLHASLGEPGGALHGPFPSGYAVTAACVGCHPESATEVMASQHWTWAGPTPRSRLRRRPHHPRQPGDHRQGEPRQQLLRRHRRRTTSAATSATPATAATPTRPSRRSRPASTLSADPTTGDSSIPLENRVDCLVCHSNPTAAYAKDPKTFGNPVSTVNLAAAAQDVRTPTRTNCGACHFYAGGADNVKLMGSSLKNPSEAIDVHMGRGMECVDCHAGPDHTFTRLGRPRPRAHGADAPAPTATAPRRTRPRTRPRRTPPGGTRTPRRSAARPATSRSSAAASSARWTGTGPPRATRRRAWRASSTRPSATTGRTSRAARR